MEGEKGGGVGGGGGEGGDRLPGAAPGVEGVLVGIMPGGEVYTEGEKVVVAGGVPALAGVAGEPGLPPWSLSRRAQALFLFKA